MWSSTPKSWTFIYDKKEYYLVGLEGFTALYVPDGLGALRRARRIDLPPNASYELFGCWDLQVYSDEYNQWVNLALHNSI